MTPAIAAGGSGEAARGESAAVTLSLEGGYRFRADFGDGFETLLMDEPPPLGQGDGPNASRVLAAAVGNCLSASLLYCLRRSHIDVVSLTTEVYVLPERNERGRLRIPSVQVRLTPVLADGSEERASRCLAIFEDYCVVTASVRGGIDVTVDVAAPPGPSRAGIARSHADAGPSGKHIGPDGIDTTEPTE